ncbi:protein TCL1B3-like [Mesocricetus auratus]|uniref:Protein TCL1B3-like n=1 Tax=Mesocricetus auratus TaxID=10036 RepID=A0A3Q0CP19_MESAU|nr:protein TCL1B3-like [Mesocricetus auratus]
MVVSLGFTPDHPIHSRPESPMTVTLCWVNECCQEPLSSFSSCLTCLPVMWKICSQSLYSGTDSRLWKLVHSFLVDTTRYLVLEMENQPGRGNPSGPYPLHPH